MTIPSPPWSEPVRLSQVGRAAVSRRLAADAEARSRIARALGLDALHALQALATLTPWLDGVELRGQWSAEIEQTCGITLEPFRTPLEGEFTVRVLPAGSRHAPASTDEVAVDPDAEDPPDVLEGDVIDLAAYVVEHLALEIDPFPRKPGAVFNPPEPESPPSPFAALKGLAAKPKGE